jgi:hypothetical protein
MNSGKSAIEVVPLRDPLGSFLRDLASVSKLMSHPHADSGMVAECVDNIRLKLLAVPVPAERVAETMVALEAIRVTETHTAAAILRSLTVSAPAARATETKVAFEAIHTVVATLDIMDRVAALYE